MWLMPAVLAAILLLVSLFAFPVIVALLSPAKKMNSQPSDLPHSIDVLIPCHNEEGRLRLTLQSVFEAVDHLQFLFPEISVQVICGLDDCTDGSADDAKLYGAHVVNFKFRSKWKVIHALASESRGQWIALVDCGVVWDKRLLRNAISYLASADVVGFSPTYSTWKSGFLSKWFWSLEAFIKSIENVAGGPISVHGATILYRTDYLKTALRFLAGRKWINDDVVLPLVMRALNPNQRIIYSRNKKMGFCVCDHAGRSDLNEQAARLRVSKGNLQWMASLLPFLWFWNKSVFVLSLRRFFRLLWVLVPIFLGLSLSLFAIEYGSGEMWIRILIVIVLFVIALRYAQKIPSFNSSLKAIRSLLVGPWDQGEEVLWK
ncbi:MAG: hypothetical protein RJB13_1556 [Pseudomonadota bacterium]